MLLPLAEVAIQRCVYILRRMFPLCVDAVNLQCLNKANGGQQDMEAGVVGFHVTFIQELQNHFNSFVGSLGVCIIICIINFILI